MNINVIALFPEVIKSSLVGVTGKAFENGQAKLNLVDLKDFLQTHMEVLMILLTVVERVWSCV